MRSQVSGGARAASPEPAEAQARGRQSWMLGIVGLAWFLVLVDDTATAIALPSIGRDLGMGLAGLEWGINIYTLAFAVLTLAGGACTDRFGTRPVFLAGLSLFTASSLGAGLSVNGGMLIGMRAAQGAGAAVMGPAALAMLLSTFAGARRALALGVWSGISATALAGGPLVGAALTRTFGWQSIFYLQIIPTSIMLLILSWGLARSRSNLRLLRNGDWLGIASLSIALGAMIITLEEGNRKDWFESEFIQRGAVVALVFFAIFFYRQLRGPNPFINVRLLKRRNFALANIIGVILGLGLYGSVFITPLYLAQVQGYNAWQTGMTMMWFGFPQLIMVPLIVRLMKVVDLRHLVAIGSAIFAASLLINIDMSADSAYDQLRLANFIRGIGQPFLSVPLAVIATVGIEPAQVGSASGLYNLTRNLGGSIGIAFLATFLTLREHFHSNHIVESVSLYSRATLERIEGLTGYFVSQGADPALAGERALRAIDAVARRESFVLAYNDCFYVMGMAFVVGVVLTYLLQSYRTPQAGAAAAAGE